MELRPRLLRAVDVIAGVGYSTIDLKGREGNGLQVTVPMPSADRHNLAGADLM